MLQAVSTSNNQTLLQFSFSLSKRFFTVFIIQQYAHSLTTNQRNCQLPPSPKAALHNARARSTLRQYISQQSGKRFAAPSGALPPTSPTRSSPASTVLAPYALVSPPIVQSHDHLLIRLPTPTPRSTRFTPSMAGGHCHLPHGQRPRTSQKGSEGAREMIDCTTEKTFSNSCENEVQMASSENDSSALSDYTMTRNLFPRRKALRYYSLSPKRQFVTLSRGFSTPSSRQRSAYNRHMRMIQRVLGRILHPNVVITAECTATGRYVHSTVSGAKCSL